MKIFKIFNAPPKGYLINQIMPTALWIVVLFALLIGLLIGISVKQRQRAETKIEKITIGLSKPSEILYTVKPGDTLGDIAKGLGTTWEKLWEANKDVVKNPDLIYPGQKLSVKPRGTSVTKVPLSPEEFNKRLYALMFRQMGMDPAPERVFNVVLKYMMSSMEEDLTNKNFYRVRQNRDSLRPILIGLETHRLSKAITSLYEKDKDMVYLITALAWKETGFHNRRGKAGELGYFQFLPSTIEDVYGKGETGKIAKVRIEEDTEFAVEFTVWYLNYLKRTYKTWDRVLYHYNGHPDYSGQVMYKLKRVKETFTS